MSGNELLPIETFTASINASADECAGFDESGGISFTRKEWGIFLCDVRDVMELIFAHSSKSSVNHPLSDEWIELYAQRHIAPHAERMKKALGLDVPYQQTEQFKRIKAYTLDVCAALSAPPPATEQRCRYCDGTGDVHRADGEWLGECTECDARKQP